MTHGLSHLLLLLLTFFLLLLNKLFVQLMSLDISLILFAQRGTSKILMKLITEKKTYPSNDLCVLLLELIFPLHLLIL